MTRLIFVYNAKAGLIAGMMDSVHKLLRPATYPCGLCAITYGALRMNPRWKAWLRTAPIEAVFHHRPDFEAAYPGVTVPLPAILRETGGRLEPVLSGPDFAGIADVDALIARLEALSNLRHGSSPESPADG